MNTNINHNFPDPLETNENKDLAAYGLKVAKSISSEWFQGGLIQSDCTFMKRKNWIEKMRLYARAQQDVKFYQNIIARQDEDLSYINLDWRPDNEAGKYVNLVANGMNEKYYRFNVTAIDKISGTAKSNYQKHLEKEMYSKKLVETARQRLGINAGSSGFVPKTMDEIDIHMNTAYKPKQEIAEELLVQYVFDANEWHNIKQQCDKDLVESGIAVVDCKTDPSNGVTLKYVDVENYIHSYTSMNDFSDKTYEGFVKKITLLDIQRLGIFSDQELRTIIMTYGSKNGTSFDVKHLTGNSLNINDYLHYEIDVLEFAFKTSKKTVYKKKDYGNGNFKLTGKKSDFQHNDTKHYSVAQKTLNTWYEGTYIIGSELVYGWKESENIAKDTQDRAQSRFITRATDIYKNQLHSFLQDIIPMVDQIHITKLKLQHIIAEIKPGGAEIDLDMLANLTGGDRVDHKEILRIFNAKGIVFKKRIADEFGMVKEGRAVEELHNGIPANLIHLLQVLQHQKNELRSITGINPSADGTQPNNALVGIQQAQLVAYNTITGHIAEASKYLKLKTAEIISTRIADIFRFKDEAKHLRAIYEKAVGKLNIKILEDIGTIHLYEFGFDMEMLPSQEEMAHFEESMKTALLAAKIDEDDVLEARAIAKKNPKYASQFLKTRKKQRQEEALMLQEQRARIKSDNDIRSGQAASQNRQQESQSDAMIEVEKEKALAMIEVQKQQMLNQVNQPVRNEEFNVEILKKQMDVAGTMKLNEFKENEKLMRQNKNNTDHSKMVQQRNEDLPAIDFSDDSDFKSLFK